MHDVPPPPALETLSPRERRLAARLESFGDIVFGFAISSCALMLTNARGRVDLTHPLALVFYFGTFALLASLWLGFHRLVGFGGAFKPAGLDLGLAFTFLALVSLVPYAMYAQTHSDDTYAAARVAVGEYQLIYLLLMIIAAVLTLRTLRRGWYGFDDEERNDMWCRLLRQSIIGVTMIVGLGIDVVAGPTVSGIFLSSMFLSIRIARRRFPHAPAARRFGIAPPAGSAASSALRTEAQM